MVLIALVIATSGCGDQPRPVSGDVEVLASWSGEELAAFRTVVAQFEERTGVRVVYSETRQLRGELAERLASGDPPDLAGLEGPAHLTELARAGHLRDLSDVLDLGAYRSRVAPTFIELGSVDGRPLGVFVRSSVKGMIWYNPSVFALGTPRTWEELERMAIRAADAAESQWCIGLGSEETSGWPGTDLIEQFVLRGSGVDAYDGWSDGELAWTSTEVRQAFERYGQMVADVAVFGHASAALATDFRQAGEPLFADPPGCLFLHQGSFMPAFLSAGGERRAGIDFDFFPFPALGPDALDAVIGGGDLFGVLTDAPAAAELMRYLVSDEAQSLWVAQGGSLSVSVGVTDYPDPISQRAAEMLAGAEIFRFDASDRMAPTIGEAFRRAVLDFTADQGRLQTILEDLDRLRAAEPRS